MTIPLLLDVVMIVLLTATIFYAFHLNKQLTALRDNRTEMQRFLQDFNISIVKSEDQVKQLSQLASLGQTKLQEVIEKGDVLKDELVFLVERGNNIADQLESELGEYRKINKKKKTLARKDDLIIEAHEHHLESEVEKELYKVLQTSK